jgi:hypothetical protein
MPTGRNVVSEAGQAKQHQGHHGRLLNHVVMTYRSAENRARRRTQWKAKPAGIATVLLAAIPGVIDYI